MLKRITAIILCIAIALSLSACPAVKPSSSASVSSEASGQFLPTDTKIHTSWFVNWWNKAEDTKYIFDEFARKYPDYEVIDEFITDIATLVAAIQANNQPDFFMGGESREIDFSMGCWQNTFAPLDKYLKDDPIVNFNTLDRKQLDLGKFSTGYYSLPYQSAGFVLLYNKKLFAQAGLDPEKPPETFTELYEYAKQLTKLDSNGNILQAGIMQQGYFNGPFAFLIEKLNGTNGTLKANGIDSNYDSDWIQYIYEYGTSFDQIYGNAKPAEGIDFGINKGNVAMDTWGNITNLNGTAQELGEDLGVAAFPHPDDYPDTRYIPSFTWYYFSIPKAAKNPNGGWLFAKFCMTDGIYQFAAKDYESNPSNYFPTYIVHAPTREKVYADFLTDVKPAIVDTINKRDELMTGNVVNMMGSPIQATLRKIDDKWGKKQSNGEVNLKERLLGIHTEYQVQIEIWKNDMISKGWTFPENAEAIPPANYND